MPKPLAPVGGRQSTAKELKSMGLKLAIHAMELRRPLVLAVDSSLREMVNDLHKISQCLYDLGVGVELGHVQLATVEPELGASDPYPLFVGAKLDQAVAELPYTAESLESFRAGAEVAIKADQTEGDWSIPESVEQVFYLPNPKARPQLWRRGELGWWVSETGGMHTNKSLMETHNRQGKVTWNDTKPSLDTPAGPIHEDGAIEKDLESLLAAESDGDAEALPAGPTAVEKCLGDSRGVTVLEKCLFDALVRKGGAVGRWKRRIEQGCSDEDLRAAVALELGERHTETGDEERETYTTRGGPDPALFIGPWKPGKRADLKGELLIAAARKMMKIGYPVEPTAKPKRKAKGKGEVHP